MQSGLGRGTSRLWCQNTHSPENVEFQKLGPARSKLEQALKDLDYWGGQMPWWGGPKAAWLGHLCEQEMTSKLSSAMESLFHPTDSYAQHWKAKSFPLSLASLLNASAPHGYTGAVLRLEKVAAKLLLGKPVTIVALGGSMTAGHGSTISWPKRLGELLSKMGYPVAVSNLGHGGTTTLTAVHRMHLWMGKLRQADLVLIDYSINDDMATPLKAGGGILNGPGAARKSYKDLVGLLLALPSMPAILTILSSHSDWVYCRDNTGVKCGSCDTDVTDFLHWKAAKDLEIPVLYYPAAVCASGSLHWLDNAGHDLAGSHPSPVTHDLFARVVLGSLLLHAKGVCHKGFTGSDLPPHRAQPETLCVTEKPLTVVSGEDPAAFVPLAPVKSWSYQPGRGAWFANETTGEIAFAISTKVGWVHLEFDGGPQYGSADVYLDSDRAAPCRLTALETAVASRQVMFETIKINAAGKHTLHLRNNGPFLLLGIYAC